MNVFVYRQPKGFEARDLEGLEELEEQLANYGSLTDDTEVIVEITAPWHKIKGLLELGELKTIWFNPQTDPRLQD